MTHNPIESLWTQINFEIIYQVNGQNYDRMVQVSHHHYDNQQTVHICFKHKIYLPWRSRYLLMRCPRTCRQYWQFKKSIMEDDQTLTHKMSLLLLYSHQKISTHAEDAGMRELPKMAETLLAQWVMPFQLPLRKPMSQFGKSRFKIVIQVNDLDYNP